MTAQELINEAMVDIGATASGELPSPAESLTCFVKLNSMLDSWNTERLKIYQISDDLYTLTNAVASYTIGRSAGASFVADNPQRIENANILSPDGVRYPLELLSAEDFSGLIYRNLTGAIPYGLYFDNAFPNATLTLWGAPQTGQQLELFTWKQLAAIAALTSPIYFPPGYKEAILYNLEVRIWPSFKLGNPVDPTILALANDAKASIERLNLPDVTQVIDSAVAGDCQNGFVNIATGGNWFR